jgi:hypothetical protein
MIRLKPTRDVGGEYEMWETDWVELFRETKPRGIIFLRRSHRYSQAQGCAQFTS